VFGLGYATKEAGSFFMPEIDDEVVLGFLNKDPRFPVILGMMYNEKSATPYTPEAPNNTKAIVTREQLKIIFNEKDKSIIIETPAENRITLTDKDKKIIIEDQNKNLIEMSPKGILIKTDKDLKIEVGGKTSIKGNREIVIESGQKIKQSAPNVEVDGTEQLKLSGGTATVNGKNDLALTGGMVRIN